MLLSLLLAGIGLKMSGDAIKSASFQSHQKEEFKKISNIADKKLAEIEKKKKKSFTISDEDYKACQTMAMHAMKSKRRR